MNNLSPGQFPGSRVRKVGGEVQHFAGWHVANKPLSIKASHKHSLNVGGADRGDVYTSFEPHEWKYGKTATEVWSTDHDNAFDPVFLGNKNENVVPNASASAGRSMSFVDAIRASKPYNQYQRHWERDPQAQNADVKQSNLAYDKHVNFLDRAASAVPDNEERVI